jgi:hypothetical protein
MKNKNGKRNLTGVAKKVSDETQDYVDYRFFGSVDSFIYSDDHLRPTWEPVPNYRLTAAHRQQLCVHLAAHAAIASLSASNVYLVAVAPAGVRSWTIPERKNPSLGKLWGICSTSDFHSNFFMWDAKRQLYVADKAKWETSLESLYEYVKDMGTRVSTKNVKPGSSYLKFLHARQQMVRARICEYLAGHIADGITMGMGATEALTIYDRRDTQVVGASDIVLARSLAGLLPSGEYEHAVNLTEAALRRPEVWSAVQKVASALEQLGVIEDGPCEDDALALLPPPEQDWPPAPDRAVLPQQA